LIKVRTGTFKHVESELYAFHDTKKEIIRLKNEILYASPPPNDTGGGRGNLPGDPTGTIGSLMVTHKRIEQLERIIDSIQDAYNQLPEEKQKLIHLKYWAKPQRLTWDGIANKLNVSRRQALYWRDEIVYAITEKIGWR
jgi:RinA family phage transcriptional activator